MRTTLLVVLFLFTLGTQAQQTDADALIGYWSGGMAFPQPLQGKLVLARERGVWRASIAGRTGTAPVAGDRFRIAFPGGSEVRGVLRGQKLEAFWLQPPGGTEDRRDPGGSGQAFASPLTMDRTDRNHWQGTVRPLPGTFTLYLRIFRNDNNILVGAFRNPELNSTGGASRLAVLREGDAVTFRLPPPPAPAELQFDAKLLSPDRLQLHWPDLGGTIELTRRTPAEVPAFFPRPPGTAAYAYQQPPNLGDGWTTARANDVGLDEAALAKLVQRLATSDPSDRRPALIHSLLIARRGKLVLEEYFFGFDRDQPHDTRSAGKTFASVMLGAAMKRGVAISPETPIYELLKAKGPFANPDPRKARITLGQLMTHTSGLACDDNDEHSPGNEDAMQRQTAQPDWWKHTLDLPMAHDPGTRYAYCSAGMNLAGAALTTATKTWLPELFDQTVARPLQFGPYYWNLLPTGEGYQGGGAFVRPRDLLKIGQTWLSGGVWNGRRIADRSWVDLSTTSHIHISPQTTGLDAEHFGESYNEADDGYAWHLNQLKDREYEASGNGGQLIMVVPQRDLVVVITAGNYMQGGIWGRWRNEIVMGEIVPAVRAQ